jgi:hypothetical protein
MAIATQQNTEIVEPTDDTLQLHTIDQKDGERRFVFANVVEKCVLQILGFFGRHVFYPLIIVERLLCAVIVAVRWTLCVRASSRRRGLDRDRREDTEFGFKLKRFYDRAAHQLSNYSAEISAL